ncbi:acyltransferase [Aspergillus sp. HF37]|nr:acyltransferase [Aspergillus sp. HF37]
MASPSSGLLDSDNLAQVELELDTDLADYEKWQPTAAVGKQKQIINWIASWIRPRPRSRSKPLHPTAYLDGLRGFAALLVYFHHHELWVHKLGNPHKSNVLESGVLESGFGYDGRFHMVAFPGVRTFFSGGHYAVSTFFVLSGYVLSIKSLDLIEKGDLTALGDHLASAFFRRWVRLFLPVAATVVVYATSWHLFGIWVDGHSAKNNWLDEMWSLYTEFKNFSFLYDTGGEPWLSYNFHVWSIPVEMKGSLVVFASLLAFSRCTVNARLYCQLALIVYFLYIADGWYCAMFSAGMLLSHLDLLAKLERLPGFLARLKPYKTIIYHHLLAISVFLGGVPGQGGGAEQLARNYAWYYLSYLKPQAVFDYKWFYLFWAAVLLVASVAHVSWLRRFLETRVCQYLGRISYALYLVHGPVLWSVGDRLYMAVGWKRPEQMKHIPHWADRFPLPSAGPYGLEVSFLLPHLILLPLTLGLADFVTGFIDRPSVTFAGWLYRKTLPKEPSKCIKNEQ